MYIHMSINMHNSIKVHYVIACALFMLLSFISFSSACQENWKCLEWQKCSYNITERQCFDANACGTLFLKPLTYESCSRVFLHCYDKILNSDETDIDCGGRDCMLCSEGKICLENSDCETNYCQNGKCSQKLIEMPAPKILSPYYAYGIFFLLFISLILIIILIIAVNHLISSYLSDKFNIDLSFYLKIHKRDIEEELSLSRAIPTEKLKKIDKKLERLNEKRLAEEKKWLHIDSIKISLPLQRRQKEEQPSPSESKKRKILKDIKAVYEYSYE